MLNKGLGVTQALTDTTPYDNAAIAVTGFINGKGKAIIGKEVTQAVASFESDKAHATLVQTAAQTAADVVVAAAGHLAPAMAIADQMSGLTVGAESDLTQGKLDKLNAHGLTEQQIKAGTLTLLAAGDTTAYAKAGYATSVSAESDVTVVNTDINPAMDYTGLTASQEAFDNLELANNLAFSVIFNTQAARQDDFGEAFFPTVVLTPDQNSLKVTFRRTMIGREHRHDQTGKAIDFKRRNLADAAFDYRVTADDTVAIVPFWQNDTETLKHFAPGIAPRTVVANGHEIQTAPYRMGQALNILGLGQNPTTGAAGQFDQTDSVDGTVNLKSLYIKVPGATPAADEFIEFNTLGLQSNQFHAADLTEGLDKDLRLSFVTSDFTLTGTTQSIANADVVGFDFLRDQAYENYYVKVALSVTGSINIEKGNIKLISAEPVVESVWEVLGNGNKVQVVDDVVVADITTKLATLKVVGYDLKANRTNTNRRNVGMLIFSVAESVRYTVPIGSPITLQAPVTDTPSNLDHMGPITAARFRNSAGAVTKILETADQLRAFEPLLKGHDRSTPRPAIEGFTRVMVQPYFHSEVIDLLSDAQGIRSYHRAEDISATFINSIRDAMYRAWRDSGYEPILQALGGTSVAKPQIVIGTDPVLSRYLMVPGDTRTMSIGFETKVVHTYDDRMRDKIYCTFVRNTAGQVDPMSFGVFAYIPELATSMPISRGSTTKETTVQPRTLHLVLCPILVEFTVRNVREAIAKQIAVPMTY